MTSKRRAHLAAAGFPLISFSPSGNFSTSCPRCDISHEQKTLTLTCACENTDTHHYTSSLDLSMPSFQIHKSIQAVLTRNTDTALYDDNGSAGCFGHLGNKSVDDQPRDPADKHGTVPGG